MHPVSNRVAAVLMLIVGAVHFQQYVDFMSHAPTVGVLFLLNAAGAAGLTLALIGPDREIRTLAALGGIGLAAGSLVCLSISLTSSFLGFHTTENRGVPGSGPGLALTPDSA
jgi:hypothetical protein